MFIFLLLSKTSPIARQPSSICKLVQPCGSGSQISEADIELILAKTCTPFQLQGYQLTLTKRIVTEFVVTPVYLGPPQVSTNIAKVITNNLYEPSLYCLAVLYAQKKRPNPAIIEPLINSIDKTIKCVDGQYALDYSSCKSFVNFRDKLLKDQKKLENTQNDVRTAHLTAEKGASTVGALTGNTKVIKGSSKRIAAAEATYAGARATFYTNAIIKLTALKKKYSNADDSFDQCAKSLGYLKKEKKNSNEAQPCEVFYTHSNILFLNAAALVELTSLLAEYRNLAINEGINIASLVLLRDKASMEESPEKDTTVEDSPEGDNTVGDGDEAKKEPPLTPSTNPTSLPQGGGGGSGGGGVASAGVPGQSEEKKDNSVASKLPSAGGAYGGSAGGSVGAAFSGDNQTQELATATEDLVEELGEQTIGERNLSGISDIQISGLSTNLFIKISKRHEELKKKNYFKIAL